MKTVVMSSEYPQFYSELSAKGYNIILSKNIDTFYSPEQYHADMQLLKLHEQIFTLRECDYGIKSAIPCEKPAGKRYPDNILLNCLLIDNKLYGKESAIDDSVKRFCKEHQIEIVNVNQGYARCSTLLVNNKAAVTADKSIQKALETNGVEVLRISEGSIRLKGCNYGFIGGASGRIDNIIFFFGNIKEHPDYEKIKMFCEKYNSKIEILCENMPLTDIGGIVEI